MKNKHQKIQQPPKNDIKQIATPHLVVLGILVGLVVLNYIAAYNASGMDGIGYAIIIYFFGLLIFLDIVWFIIRLLSAKPTNKTPKIVEHHQDKQNTKK